MTQRKITDDIQNLIEVLPPAIADAVTRANDIDNLIEIIMDLGRVPQARFVKNEVELSHLEITNQDIEFVTGRIGDFDADNRAGLERTLHRISAFKNRRGHVVGLTCRVGRAVYGTIDIIKDLVESGKSILILGRPGIGKTTILREAARILAEGKRVIVVDTSNEIGGDGDVPHPAVGKARRMQVPTPSLQHEVMIEAVENHNPEVIVIDEIGRELEAMAARTIAERGVQLIGTAHGRTLENLLLNPTLSDLIGGIESVTLSDEEARRRGTQKTVLERRAPPTFDVLIEMIERDKVAVHPDVASAVDTLVRGTTPMPEIRSMGKDDQIHIEKPSPAPLARQNPNQGFRRGMGEFASQPGASTRRGGRYQNMVDTTSFNMGTVEPAEVITSNTAKSVRLYPFGVARNRLIQASRRLGVPVQVEKNLEDAEALITLRAYYRNRQQTILDAEERGLPIYVLRANTINQIEQSLADMFNLSMDVPSTRDWQDYTSVTRSAIEAVINGTRWIDLPPATAPIRRLQHEMARQANLVSHSYGKDPNRYVRIFRE